MIGLSLAALFCLAAASAAWLFVTAKPAPPSALVLPQKQNGPLVIAHADDAGGGLYPGNTLLYLQKMVEQGVDVLELDLNLTADGHLVMMHDTSVDRTTEGSGMIRDLTLAQLRELNVAHNWTQDGDIYPYREQPQRIATIDEVFAAVPDTPIIIELKDSAPQAAQVLCESVRRFERQRGVIVSSFRQPLIDEFRRLCPQVATGAAMRDALVFYAAQLVGAERLLSPRFQTMQLPMRWNGIDVFSARLLRAAKSLGMHVSVWTVNDPADMQRYIELGVDGILTDRPDRLHTLLQQRAELTQSQSSGGY